MARREWWSFRPLIGCEREEAEIGTTVRGMSNDRAKTRVRWRDLRELATT
ncbi:MAG: hypothetical protein AB1646_12700 [Thermodesulfobacteriota bacterium]